VSSEAAILNNNRHATCVDCHDAHTSRQTIGFQTSTLRGAVYGVRGVSSTDGSTVLPRISNGYENCLRCHGISSGKQVLARFGYAPLRVETGGDPLNLLPQFGTAAISSHPVMHDRNSTFAQPSLLQLMLNQDGKTQARSMGTRILCTDCHNSDDNREFGGSGPNGPHGSLYPHILERRYEMSRVVVGAGAGTLISNLFPNPSLDPSCTTMPCASPYALCAKCHDLNSVMANASFSQHALHIKEGFSCSVCHTAHGMTAGSNSTGHRLVNFDLNVVASNNGAQIRYIRGSNSCSLVCHSVAHNANGSVSKSNSAAKPGTGRR
jgi:hypothetical protein